MFVIVYDNSVILGPMKWQKFRFENTIKEDCDVTATLNTRNDNNEPVIVSDRIKILPVQGTDPPPYNPRIEILHGPFWDFSNNIATYSYQPRPMTLEAAAVFLKHEAKEEKRKKLAANVPVTLNGVEYQFDTTDKTINGLNRAIDAQLPEINWKLDTDLWVILTPTTAAQVLAAIISHIQNCFDWELTKIEEINACTTLEQLANIEIVSTQPNNGN